MPSLTANAPQYALPTIETERIVTLAERLQLSRPFAQLLLARGIDSSPALKAFLHPRYTADPDARHFHNGEALIARLVQAIRQSEPILVHGDYDVDGICGSVIYRRGLEALGGRVRGFLPSRFKDGYGVSMTAIDSAVKSGIKIVLTADTGSQAYDATQACLDAGIDICITDHHELGARLPDTPWFINPRQPDCTYPYKGLSGGGIAMKVILAVGEALGKPLDPESLIPYATLSTIADVCPLTLENRAIVNQGLTLIQQPRDPGLRALVDFTRKAGTSLSARDLAFGVIPLLNAAGRIEDPRASAQLLLAGTASEARAKLQELQALNEHRKRITDTVFEQAAQQAEQQLTRDSGLRALVVAAPQWHFGVVGIVAARLVDRYGLPTICLTQHQDQQRMGAEGGPYLYTGSGRAPDGIALLTAVQQCRAEIEHCGGHEAALGIGIHEGSIIAFRERLSAAVAELPASTSPPRTLDGQLDPADITPRFLAELARVEPCGAGNPSPRFLIGPFEVEEETGMKGNAHRSLGVHDARGTTWRAVQFNVRPGAAIPAGPIGIIGTPVLNKWKGTSKIELSIESLIEWPTSR